MANLSETASYDAGVYQLETTDPVQGGSTGVANAPLKNLANRTAYLKQVVDALVTAIGSYAPLASPALTGSPTAPTQALGDSSTKIATDEFVQKTLGGYLQKSVAGSANVTLTAVEAGNGILEFVGALTGNINVIVPGSPTRNWIIKNNTTGSFTLTVKTAAGTGMVCAQGYNAVLWTDGANVYDALTDFDNVALTGSPTTPTPTAGDSSTKIASTAFVATAVSNAVSTAIQSTITQGTVNGGGTAPFPATGGPSAVDYTGIPSWVKRIVVSFRAADVASGRIVVQLGTAAGIVATGYTGGSGAIANVANSTNATAVSNGFSTRYSSAAVHGIMIIEKLDGNLWAALTINYQSGADISAGTIDLGGQLTQLRITGGTFNAGYVNIAYEG